MKFRRPPFSNELWVTDADPALLDKIAINLDRYLIPEAVERPNPGELLIRGDHAGTSWCSLAQALAAILEETCSDSYEVGYSHGYSAGYYADQGDSP